MKHEYLVREASVWVYPGLGGWHFVYIPKKFSDAIRLSKYKTTGFGFIPVQVTVGASTWETVLIWSAKESVYLVALKAAIRKREKIYEHDKITLKIRITEDVSK